MQKNVIFQDNSHLDHEDKLIINRMTRALKSMEYTIHLAEEGKDSSEVLNQLSEVRAAINNIGKVILKSHIKQSMIEECGESRLDNISEYKYAELKHAIDKFFK